MLAEHSGRGTAGWVGGIFFKNLDIFGHFRTFGLAVLLRRWRDGSEGMAFIGQ